VLEIVYNSHESISDSSTDSVSSSDNEIDDISLADAIIYDDSGNENEVLHRDIRWETMDNYRRHRDVFSCDFGPRNSTQNISGILQTFELFFDIDIIETIARESNRCTEQYKYARGNLFSFRSLVRSWTPVTESEILHRFDRFLLMGIVQKRTARSNVSKRRVI